MALAHRGEVPGRLLGVAGWREVEDTVFPDALGIEQRVLAVHVADAVAECLHDSDGIDPLPPEVAGVEIEPDVPPDMRGERLEARAAEDGDAWMHLETDHDLGRFLRQPVAGR